MDGVTGLKTLAFGELFNQSLERFFYQAILKVWYLVMTLSRSWSKWSCLRNLTFGAWFRQGLESVRLPTGLQSLTSNGWYEQGLQPMILPSAWPLVNWFSGARSLWSCQQLCKAWLWYFPAWRWVANDVTIRSSDCRQLLMYVHVYANGCQTVRVVTHIFNMGWGGVGWGC